MNIIHSTAPSTSRVALTAAGLCCVGWSAKAIAIGLVGGLGLSPAEGPLFLFGALTSLVALAFLILTWTAHRPRPVRVLAAVGALPLAVGLSATTRLAVWAIEPDEPSWVWAEVNLWMIAVALLGAALVTARRAGGTHPMPAAIHPLAGDLA